MVNVPWCHRHDQPEFSCEGCEEEDSNLNHPLKMIPPRCYCKCCTKRSFEEIEVAKQLLIAIDGLKKIEGTPQFGLAYSIAQETLKKIRDRNDRPKI